MTKNFAKLVGRPLFLTAGLRESEAAQLGFLGFGDTYHTTFEGNVVYHAHRSHRARPTSSAEKHDPYGTIASDEPGEFLVGHEDNWHAIDAAYILNKHTTFCAGWGHLGNLVNAASQRLVVDATEIRVLTQKRVLNVSPLPEEHVLNVSPLPTNLRSVPGEGPGVRAGRQYPSRQFSA